MKQIRIVRHYRRYNGLIACGIKSIIKDWSKVRDWELKILADKGYEQAIEEQKKRSQIVRSRC